MSRNKKIFAVAAALVTLPLLAGCDDDNAQGHERHHPFTTSESIRMGGATVNAVEFRSATKPDLTCINISPYTTWTGTTQACFTNPQPRQNGQIKVWENYRLSSNGSTLLVTEFTPASAPHILCTFSTPRTTWNGTTLSCAPR